MSKELVGKFLPLGSMLKLKGTEDDNLLYFVVARAIKENEAAEIVPRYKVAPHPYGDIHLAYFCFLFLLHCLFRCMPYLIY